MFGVGGAQEVAITEFYEMRSQKVLLSKSERQKVWRNFKETRTLPSALGLETACPALYAELRRAISSGNYVQSAVFSECVYSQTLANQLGLELFVDLRDPARNGWSSELRVLLRDSPLVPRYLYRNASGSISLVQAGGHAGIDAILVAHDLGLRILIEFKEPKAKTSEPDLPKYREDGLLRVTDEWATDYPQFMPMVEEQIGKSLNFFDAAGSNINDFTPQAIQKAVRDNYAGQKFADVVCTEDRNDYLTVLPAHQLGLWADLKGEIRPAGRNHYQVWTPEALQNILATREGVLRGDKASVPIARLTTVAPRGGTGISRYKIHPLFFVRAEDVIRSGSEARFRIDKVRQLNPTISAHMYFTGLDVSAVRDHYLGGR